MSSSPQGTEMDLDGELPATEPTFRGKPPSLRFNSVAITLSALVALYLGYVLHFATNAPQGDDWSVVPLIHTALHGHLTLGGLWVQHLESRIFFPNILFVVSGFVDRYDLRSITLISAIVWIVTYFILLRVYRAYDNRPLTVVPCAVLGLIWFSVADVKNILWAFQVAWFIIVFCFMLLLYLLTVSSLNRPTVLALALVVTVVGSFSAVQGLVLWPMGLFLILWRTPWSRRTSGEAGVWAVGCILTLAVFFRGYHLLLAYGLCPSGDRCTRGYLLSHPAGVLAFSTRLLGDIYPTVSIASGVHEILGTVLAMTAIYVIVQTFRERRTRTRAPLPAALILFAVLFDAMIVYGRFGYGAPNTLQYVMPQLVLLTGIAAYVVPRIRAFLLSPSKMTGFRLLRVLCLCSVILLAVEVVWTTSFGISQAGVIKTNVVEQARLVVNLPRIPQDRRFCYEGVILAGGILPGALIDKSAAPIFQKAREDRLTVFSPGSYKDFYAEGPPHLPGCDQPNVPSNR